MGRIYTSFSRNYIRMAKPVLELLIHGPIHMNSQNIFLPGSQTMFVAHHRGRCTNGNYDTRFSMEPPSQTSPHEILGGRYSNDCFFELV